jgi:hypothetical protein
MSNLTTYKHLMLLVSPIALVRTMTASLTHSYVTYTYGLWRQVIGRFKVRSRALFKDKSPDLATARSPYISHIHGDRFSWPDDSWLPQPTSPTSTVIDRVDLLVGFHGTTGQYVPEFITELASWVSLVPIQEPTLRVVCSVRKILPAISHVLGKVVLLLCPLILLGYTPLDSLRNFQPYGWCSIVDGSAYTILSRTLVVCGSG